MTKQEIRLAYADGKLGYYSAIRALMLLGFTEYAADQFLFYDR